MRGKPLVVDGSFSEARRSQTARIHPPEMAKDVLLVFCLPGSTQKQMEKQRFSPPKNLVSLGSKKKVFDGFGALGR